MYICGGSFGSFGSAEDKKNEKWIIWALSVGCMYVVACLARQWLKRTRKRIIWALSVGCTLVYVCGGSFGSAVSKRAKRASSFEDVCKRPYIL